MQNFAQRFCEFHHVRVEGYARAMFWRCLHRWAVPVALFILWMNREYFAADYAFILGVGAITSRGALHSEIEDFESHPLNDGMCRRRLKLRVSVKRLNDQVSAVMPCNAVAATVGSAEPWAPRGPERTGAPAPFPPT